MRTVFDSELAQRDKLITKLLAQIEECAKIDEVYSRERSDAKFEAKGTSYTKFETDFWFVKSTTQKRYYTTFFDDRYQLKDTVQKLTHHDVLKWLHENGDDLDEEGCEHAVSNNRLDILKYLLEIGCPWNHRMCTIAARNNHLVILKYLIEAGCPWNCCECNYASHHKDIMDYLRNTDKPCSKENCVDCTNRLNELFKKTEIQIV